MSCSSYIRRLLVSISLAAAVSSTPAPAAAWDRGTVAYGGPRAELAPVLPDSSSHLLGGSVSGPKVGIRISNLTGRRIERAFLYLGITDFSGRGIQDFKLETSLNASGDTVLYVDADGLAGLPGFYDVRALLFNSGQELGELEFSFGYDLTGLDHDYSPPLDFDSFWRATLDSLNAVPPALSTVPDSERSSDEVEVYRISYSSLHGVRVDGWLTLPTAGKGPLAGLAFFPGYSSGRISPATDYSRRGYAAISIQVRGYEVDRESYPENNSRYMTIGCERPESYIYREIVCHCLRAVDLLAARPEVDENRIGVVGGSQGGGLGLLVAGLDPRVAAVVASVPFLTDFERSMTMSGAPFRDLVRYIEQKPGSRDQVMNTVRYFDTVSLAGRIKAPVIVSAGLFDRTCPVPSIYRMYHELGSVDKRIEIYPWLDHLEVGRPFMPVARQWLAAHLPPYGN
ncbi:MAG: acetylxylan esterase [Candidatus Glassbacteria bacterium]|nr:acetylxylan esterase [Candidatus Glassbacteria bacterium]